MPFRSKRQQRFMYATKPKGVDLEEWAKETDFDKLPEKVRKKKRKKKDKSDLRGGPTPIPRSKIIEFLLSNEKQDKNDVFQGPDGLEAHGDRALQAAETYQREVKLAFDMKDLGHLALDIAGLVPVIGEAADFANAIWYCTEGRYLLAALSVISMIPEIGDAVGKGSKTLAFLAKNAPEATAFVSKHAPKIIQVIKDMRAFLKTNARLIDKAFDLAAENQKLAKYIPEMKEALEMFISAGSSSPEDD